MQEFSRFFGEEFKKIRLAKNLSQWEIALKIPYHIRNLQRIEKGVTQPGISLAFKLINALDARPGDFLAELAHQHQKSLPASIFPLKKVEILYNTQGRGNEPKSLFGPLLHQARLASGISQTAMAKAAFYNLRNINAVEKGLQEPGIMTALALVRVTGASVRDFFNTLYLWRKELINN